MPTISGAIDKMIGTLEGLLNPTHVIGGVDSMVLNESETGNHHASTLCFGLIARCEEAIREVQPLLKHRVDGVKVSTSLTHYHLSQPAHTWFTAEMVKLHEDLIATLEGVCAAMQSTACMQWGDVMLLCVAINAASVQGSAGIKRVRDELEKARDQQDGSLTTWARERKDSTLHASKLFGCASICENIDELLKRREERLTLLHAAAKRAAILSSKLEAGNLSMAFDGKQARAHASIANIQVSPWVARAPYVPVVAEEPVL